MIPKQLLSLAGSLLLAAVLSVGLASMADAAGKKTARSAKGGAIARPPLIRATGRYFSWAAPQGWHHSESTNGVDLTSPDKKQQAGFYLLLRTPGSSTPEQFLSWLGKSMKLRDFRIISVKEVPSQSGEVTREMEFTGVDPTYGPRHGGATVAIMQGYGQFDTFWQAFSTTPGRWETDKLWLPVLARSVTIINSREVAGNNTIIHPRNNPLDNSGLINSWKEKNLSEDRISQARREGTMGYERMKSPTSGRIYEMPLETYDGTKGGYHNPDHYNEILQRAPAGE
ncbi:hypothetical protein [Geomesophilobacter sediminis]|uniref:Uncharacterized protein n=1 Tax=Geomesophilobacter sediminis TaxID=2798584 RepID=A0A8J7LVH6_9BACT|nr:hypothetical protein [Geomesophilobacter sediminis]MBJ6725534.1 hypothetical protein [Geomesophilobacter sediminis]